MSKCVKCGRHGLFLLVNIRTGLCSDCQKLSQEKPVEITQPVSIERSIEIPTIYIGNCLKSRLIEKFEDVELLKPDSIPDFSKIGCCDDVYFSIENDVIIAKNFSQVLGCVNDETIASKIRESLNDKKPIFSQILGYDDETGEIHLVIAFYKIVNYDYNDYAQERDESLDSEIVGYY